MQAGRSEDELLAAFLEPINAGGAKVREQRDPRAYVRRCWVAAQRYLQSHPGLGDVERARDYAHQVFAVAMSQRWPAKAGATDFFVLVAHIYTASIAGRVYDYGLSLMKVKELAGITQHKTARRSQARLIKKGWIGGLPRAAQFQPSRWSLHIPEEVTNTPLRHTHDIWVWQGLGKSAARVWIYLSVKPMTISEMHQVSGISRATIHRILRNMVDLGWLNACQTAPGGDWSTLAWRFSANSAQAVLVTASRNLTASEDSRFVTTGSVGMAWTRSRARSLRSHDPRHP
jgi:hypothetical protein